MAKFKPRAMKSASFSGLAAALPDGVDLFLDAPFRYLVANSDIYRIDVVRRTSTTTFSGMIAQLSGRFKAVINGNYFTGSGLYARAHFGVVEPGSVDSQGDVVEDGAVVLPDAGSGSEFFFFGRDASVPPKYNGGGPSNPTGSIDEGMGGLGPLILPNPISGGRLRYGVGNRYQSDPKKRSIPQTDAEWRDCIQRNNNTYASINREAANGTGFCAVAVVPDERLVLLIAKPHKIPGTLDTLRDKLFEAGATLACFTDGSNSTCMAVDRKLVPGIEPAGFKDNLIETGFALFRYRSIPPTKVRVRFTEVEIHDDAEVFGSSTWTIQASAQGVSITLLNSAEVSSGDVIAMSFVVDATVESNKDLIVQTKGRDTSDGDVVGSTKDTFAPTLSPKFGAGAHRSKSSTGHYSVTYEISLVP